MMKILGAADGKLSFSDRTIGGPEQIPGVAVLGDGRIVGIFDVAFDL